MQDLSTPDLLQDLLIAELRLRKLSLLLAGLGAEDCPWLPALNEPIARLLNLDSDQTFNEYDQLMDKQSRDLNPTNIRNAAKAVLLRFQAVQHSKNN